MFNTDASNTTVILGANNANLNLGGHGNGVAAGNMIGLLNLANVSNFFYNTGATGTGQFQVGFGTRSQGQFIGATNNSITAALVDIGDSSAGPAGDGGNQNSGGTSNLALGSGTNTITTPTITIGNGKAGGILTFATASGTLTIAGQTGGASTANIAIGNAAINGGSDTTASTLAAAGHNVTVQAGNVAVASVSLASATTTVPGSITFDTGTFNVANLSMANNSGGPSTVGPVANVTIGGPAANPAATGIFNVTNSFLLANNTNTATAATAISTFTINGGTVNTNANILRVGKSNTTFTMNAGTLNLNGHSIGSAAAPLTTINLAGGTVTNVSTIAAANITLGSTLSISGAQNFVLDNAGVLNSGLPLLALGTGGGISGGGATQATVNGSVSLGSGAILSPGNAATSSTIQFANDLTIGGGATLTFKLGPTPGSGDDLVNVGGNLSLSGTIGLNILALGAGATVNNTYTLFNYTGTLTGNETNFSIAGAGARTTYTIVPTSTTPNSIQVSVGGSAALQLTYIGTPTNSNWNLQGDANFKDTSANTQKFFNLDMVTFDDTSSNLNPVQIIGNLQPGAVTVNASRDYTFAGTGSIIGTIGLTKSGSGNLTVANNNTYSGGTTINGGIVNVGNGGTTGSIGAGNVTLQGGNLNINRSDAFTFSNFIFGSGNLAVSGSGTTLLNGSNSFLGAVNLNAGTTKIANSASLGSTSGGPVTIASGATLDLGGDTTTNDAALNFQGRSFVVSGTGVGGLGAIINTGVSQQNAFKNIQLTGDTTFSGFRFDIGRNVVGNLDLQGHTLTLNMNAAASSLFAILTDVTVTPGQIIVNSGGISIERNAVITNDGTSTITYMPNTEAFFFAPNPVNITRQMIFKGGNIIGAGDATATSAINNPMTIQGSVTLEPMSNGVPAPGSSFPLALQNNITESGGSFAVNKLGVNTNVLSGANSTWSGASILDAGVLEFAVNATTGTNTSSIGSYSGNGTMTVDAGVNMSSGGLQIAALNVNGALQIRHAATPSVSKVGALTLAGGTGAWSSALDITNSKLIVEDASANHAVTLATTLDQVNFGKTNPDGILNSTLTAGFGMAVMDNAVLNNTSFGGVTVDAGSILVSQEVLGDANADGHVDLTDLSTVLNNFGANTSSWLAGNFDANATIDLTDVSDVLNNFGASNPNATASPAIATPEPASLALLGLAAPALLKRRKHA